MGAWSGRVPANDHNRPSDSQVLGCQDKPILERRIVILCRAVGACDIRHLVHRSGCAVAVGNAAAGGVDRSALSYEA